MIVLTLTDYAENACSIKEVLMNRVLGCDRVICLGHADLERNIAHTSPAEFLFSTWNMACLSRRDIRKFFPNLKAVFYVGGNTDYFAQPFIELGVQVFEASNENAISVAEFVTAQILLANKGYFQSSSIYKSCANHFGFHRARKYSRSHTGNFGATVGLIGLGNVGMKVLRNLRSFDVKVMVCDPRITKSWADANGVVSASLREVFSEANIVSNHLPDIPETIGALDYGCFSQMPSTGCFINTGRGRQVVEQDLIKALKERPSRTALLDVTAREPLLPFSALARLPNVFLTPHIAGSQSAEVERMCMALVEEAAKLGYLQVSP